ncbi:Transposable element Tc1 transposase [Araneus ventricosus]|uniref:Transposable element Tc1 transposase n=1 Tax=Araneus ventricosus TaxID=182803 RepID=A0A4Y2L5K9_ARAVE|nr:Transposable element Tc1 transposase [Araneus ventricosus]
MEDAPSRNRLSLRRIARRVWNGRRRTRTGPRKSGKMSFGVMKAITCCLTRMVYSAFVVSKVIVSTPKCQIPTMKHAGGNVKVWRCVSRLGMDPLRRIQGIMDMFQYEDILENAMRPYACNYLGRGFIFQQDIDPKHRSKHIQN